METTNSPRKQYRNSSVARKVVFEIAQDENMKWHWQLWSANGRAMGTNAVPYDRRKDVLAAIKNIIGAMADAKYVVEAKGESTADTPVSDHPKTDPEDETSSQEDS